MTTFLGDDDDSPAALLSSIWRFTSSKLQRRLPGTWLSASLPLPAEYHRSCCDAAARDLLGANSLGTAVATGAAVAPQSNRTRNHRRAQSYRQRLRRPCQSPPSRYRHRHLLRVRARVGLLRLSVSPAVSGCAVRSENWNSKCAELRRLLAARVDAQIAFSKENARRVCAVLRRRYRSRSYGRLRGCRVCEVGGPVVLTLKPARAGSATCDVHSISHAR